MKKLIALLLLLSTLAFCFTACGEQNTTKLRVGYLTGPTGIGMAKLIQDNGGVDGASEKYSFKNYADNAVLAQSDLTAGNIDLICVPTNNIAQYYNTDNDITVLSLNALGSLYLVAKDGIEINSIDDLEGKTVYTCQQGTPKIILDTLIAKAGVNATISYTTPDGTVMDKPNKIAPQVIAGKIDIAVFPEPQVANALSKNANYKLALDLGDVWEEEFESGLTMGCIVAKKSFVEANESAVKKFLNEYEASIEFMAKSENLDTAADYVISAGIIPLDKAVVKNAISNLGEAVAYVDGEDMKVMLKKFYEAVKISAPDDEFYYEK